MSVRRGRRVLRDRARLTDEDWERLMRAQGWSLAPADVDADADATVGADAPGR